MMKRFLSLALAVALIVVLALPVLVVPSKAVDDYNPWIDIAEVCTVNNSGSNYFAFTGSTTVTLSPGFSTIVNQIDMIWFCGYGAPSAVYLWRASSASSRVRLNIQHIGGSYYRIYGNVSNYTMSEYKFDIETGTTSYRSYEIKTCRIAESVATYPVDLSYMFDEYYGATVSEYEGSVSVSSGTDIKYGTSQNWILELYPDGWKGYDYLDVLVSTNAASIGSIAVMQNDRSLPFDVSYLYSDSGSYAHSNDIYSSPLEPNVSVLIHIDVSSVSRTSSILPAIRIEGWWNSGVGCDIQFSCIGYIASSDRTGVGYWFEKAKDFLSDLFGEGEGQESVDNLDQGSDSISQGASDIGSFEQSQQDTLNTGFATITAGISFTSFSAALLFVQKYANMIFNGISQYAIVFTLPLFLGLFFYLCSRIPGVTRWKSRPPRSQPSSKGGKSP